MTRSFVSLAAAAVALLLAGGCGSPPTPQETELDQRANHPEVLPGGDTELAAPPGGNQAGAQQPGGPVSDQGSAQGDTTPPR